MSSTVCKSVLSLALLVGLPACGGSDKSGSTTDDLATDEVPTDRQSKAPPSFDDDEEEDDEGLAIQGLRGRLEPHQIQAGLQPRQSAMTGCYEKQYRKQKYLGGDVKIEVVVGPEGTVDRVRMLESEVGSWAVEGCLIEAVAKAKFDKPKGGNRIATFDFPLSFKGSKAVLWWPEERIEEPLSDSLVTLEACEGAPADVWVTLYIGVKGVVKSVGFSSGEYDIPDEWATCATEAVLAWVMPDPRGKMAKTGFRYSP